MRSDRPSLTAALVSFARGAASSEPGGPCFDPIAARLVPPPFTHLLRLMEDPGRRRLLEPLLRAFSFGLLQHLELRTAMIDRALEDALCGGIRQVVVLGAGLDSRAWRMDALRDADVYEVDHPATQGWKTAHIAGQAQRARQVHFVPVDFERSSLAAALDPSSFQVGAPTFWIWEGVTPYLEPDAIEGTLTALANRSAAGSRIVLSYVTPDLIAARPLRAFAFPVFMLISEPLKGVLPRERMHQLLERHGWRVRSDELPAEVGPRFGRSARRALFSPSERVLVAER